MRKYPAHLKILAMAVWSAGLFGLLPSANADNPRWIGALEPFGSQFWNNPGSWSSGIVPNSPFVDVTIDQGPTAILAWNTPSVQVHSITIKSPDAGLVINGGTLTTPLIDVQTGTLRIVNDDWEGTRYCGVLSGARIQGAGMVNIGDAYGPVVLSNIVLASQAVMEDAIVQNSFRIDGGSLHLYGQLTANFTMLQGTGLITFEGGIISGGSNLIISPGVTLQSQGVGEIQAGTVTIQSGLSVSPGGGHGLNKFSITGSLVNQGSVVLNQGTLILNGAQTSTQLGTIIRDASSSVYLYGSLAAPGGKLDIDSVFHGVLNLGGSTDAAVIAASSGSHLIITPTLDASSSFNIDFNSLTGVTLATDVEAINGNSSRLGTLQFAGGLTLNNSTARVGTYTVSLGTGVLDGTGTFLFGWKGGGLVSPNGATLTIGAGITLSGDTSSNYSYAGFTIGSPSSALINSGLIAAASAATTITITGHGWKNSGTLSVSAGSMILSGTTSTDDLGLILHTGGSLVLQNYYLENAGANFALDIVHRTWTSYDGKFHGGTITSAGGAISVPYTSSAPMFDNVTLVGNFSGSNFNRATFSSLTLQDAVVTAAMTLSPQTVAGTGTLVLNDARFSEGTVVLSAGITCIGSGTINGSYSPGGILINQGLIRGATGQSFTANSVINQGTISSTGGAAISITNLANAGLISLPMSTLTLGGAFSNDGTIDAAGSTIVMSGTFASGMLTAPVINLNGTISGAGTVMFNGGTLKIGSTTTAVSSSIPLVLSGSVTLTRSPAASKPDLISSPFSGNATLALTLPANEVLAFNGEVNQFAGFTGTISLGTSSGMLRLAGRDNANNPFDHGLNQVVLDVGSSQVGLSDGGTQTIGALTGMAAGLLNGTMATGSNVTAATFVVGTLGTHSTFLGAIRNGVAGTASYLTHLVKVGTGTLTLGTGSVFTGSVTVNGGTLAVMQLTDGGLVLSGSVTSGSSALVVSSTTGLTTGMALVGNDLPLGTKINAISGNTLTLSAPAVGSSSISLTAFQPGSLGGSTAAPSNLVINGGTLKYLGSGITTDRLFTMGSSGATLDASGAGRISFTNPNDLAFLNPNEASTLTLSGTNSGLNTLAAMIGDNGTGATTVAKSGSGTWVLAGTCNTFSGGIDLLGGQLQLASYGALPAGAVIKFAGGALQYNTSNISPNMLFRDHFSSEAGQAYAIDTNGLAITFDSPLTGGQHIPQNGSRHADVQRGQYLHG